MAVKLYGSAASPCTQRVIVAAKELGLAIQLVNVDVQGGEHKSPEFLKKQPFGQIPYLEDSGFILFESRAICRYLASAHADGKLIPKGAKENALFEQAASIEQNNFQPYASVLARERVYAAFLGKDGDEAKAAAAQVDLENKLDAYEIILSKHKFLAGDELTLVDLFHLSYGTLAAMETKPGNGVLNFKDSKRPNVSKWWTHISTLPSWLATLAESKAAMEASQKK